MPNGDDPATKAFQSLYEFHQGQWKGQARSFTISDDVAAGILQRKQSPPYTCTADWTTKSTGGGYQLTETFGTGDKIASRKLCLTDASMDVDVVDASYSLDQSLPDLPSWLTGSDGLPQFVLEHCLATSETRRARLWAIYGLDQSLSRVVVCEEEKVDAQPMPESSDAATTLSPHPVSLMELSSGVWLGDAIIREQPSTDTGKGFGKKVPRKQGFAEWTVGVQKVAWRWMWNFGEEIRQVNDAGKAMCAALVSSLTESLGGAVCVNEGLSRRMARDERMVYLDWSGTSAGFLVGSYSIQVGGHVVSGGLDD